MHETISHELTRKMVAAEQSSQKQRPCSATQGVCPGRRSHREGRIGVSVGVRTDSHTLPTDEIGVEALLLERTQGLV
jgi:hypothetical protein